MSKPTITTSYSGASAQKFIAASLLEGTTLANGGVSPRHLMFSGDEYDLSKAEGSGGGEGGGSVEGEVVVA